MVQFEEIGHPRALVIEEMAGHDASARQHHRLGTRRPAEIDGVGAARVKGAAARQAQERRGEPGNALKDPLVVEAGQALDQRVRVGMLGVGEHLADRADLDQPSRIHHRHLVDELRHQPHVVADQDDRGADLLADAIDRLHHLALGDHVERAGRLVGDDHLRAQQDADGDADALLHAAAELVGVHAEDARVEIDRLQGVHGAIFGDRPRLPEHVRLHRVQHLGADPHHRVERVHRALRDIGDLAEARLAHRLAIERHQIGVADDHAAALDPPRRLDHAHHGQRHRALA